MQTTCNTENQYITSISSIVRKALGSCSTVIARIVSAKYSAIALFNFQIQHTCNSLRVNIDKYLFRYSLRPCDYANILSK